MYITDLTDDKEIIVSSWEKKYIFENNDAYWTSKILLKTKK